MIATPIQAAREEILARGPSWLDLDHQLMTQPEGWRRAAQGGGYEVWRRRMPDDPNDLFLWRIPALRAPREVVFEGFVQSILEYHRHWTKEFAGGRVVEEIGPDARIVHQEFDPGVPGIKKRDLCHATVTRRLADGSLQASHRSVDAAPSAAGFERIRWRGASLCLAGASPGESTLVYLDREDQGGRFPAWLMNLLMPGYLRYQCEKVMAFFARGGPPELSRRDGTAPLADRPSLGATTTAASPTAAEPLWLGGFAPVRREHGFEPLTVEGALPGDLKGTLYFASPARVPGAEARYLHHGDGDGAVTAVRLQGGRASGALRFVRTRSFEAETAAGEQIYRGYALRSRRPVREMLGDRRHSANTHVVQMDGRILALAETGHPVEISPEDLSTRGAVDLGGLGLCGFSAHPHHVPARRATYYAPGVYGLRNAIELCELPDAGPARRLARVPLDGVTVVHDFAVTERHALFIVSPLRFDLLAVGLNRKAPGDATLWRPEQGCEVVVVPLDRPDAIVRFHMDPCMVFHFLNAYESPDGIVVDFVRYESFGVVDRWFRAMPFGQRMPPVESLARRGVIDVRARRIRVEPLADDCLEFPRIAPAVQGAPYRFAYCAGFTPRADGMPDRLAKLSVEGRGAQSFALVEDWFVNEPIFVPRRGAAAEDDGYVLCLVHDGARDRGLLAVFDARDPARGAVATAAFDHAIPYTFHGSWVRS